MTRLSVAYRLLAYTFAQMGHLAKISASLLSPSFLQQVERSFGKYLTSVFYPFDQSSSNFTTGRIDTHTNRNVLIENLERLAADIYRSRFARISLAGSSSSLRQIFGHVVPRSQRRKKIVLLDPACHKSAFGGLIEGDLSYVFLRRSYSKEYGIVGPIDEVHFQACMKNYRHDIAAVLLTHPTYEGFGSDLAPISSACREAGILLCLDCAWGSNFGLAQDLPDFPIADADIVITSPHKKGGAPSQVGLVLFNDPQLKDLYDEANRVGCESTSLNWPLLLLFEQKLRTIADGYWATAWQNAVDEAGGFRKRVSDMNNDLVCPAPQQIGFTVFDPTHVYISTLVAGVNGSALAALLSSNFNIDAEMAGPNGVLFLFGPRHVGKTARLAKALTSALHINEHSKPASAYHAPLERSEEVGPVLHPRPAYFSETQTLELEKSIGSTSASLIYAYPPGIPLLAYGEQITAEHVEAINRLLRAGVVIAGLASNKHINVTRAPPNFTEQPRPLSNQNRSDANMPSSSQPHELRVQSYPFGETPESVAQEVARLFREIFCNPPYNQFAAQRLDPTTPLSFSALAPPGYVAAENYQPLGILDATELPPDHFRWMEPDEFDARFRAKAHQLYISTGRDKASNDMRAFVIGRVLTVRELFYTEEFRNPIYYSGREYIETLRPASEFYRLMRFHFGLEPDDHLFFTIGMGAHPSARGDNFMYTGLRAIGDHIISEHMAIPSFGEVASSGAGRIHSEAVHKCVVHGILQSDHALVYAETVESVVEHYFKGPLHVGERVRALATAAKQGYLPHPADHANVEIRDVPGKGLGVFATHPIQAGDLIAEFIGVPYSADRESYLPSIMKDRCIQIGPKTYVFAENRLAEKINHSCRPNCGVREKTKIVAIYPISAGEEICWDYRMSENSDWVLENCRCGTDRCAGRIEGYDSLPEDIRLEYLKRGAISTWLLDT